MFYLYITSAIEGPEETKQKGKKGAQSATGDKQVNADTDMEQEEQANNNEDKSSSATNKLQPASPEQGEQVG